MQRNERLSDPTIAFITAFEGMQSGLWTSVPGTVRSYDPAKGTVSVTPALRLNRRLEDGSTKEEQLPLLVDVPVVFPGGGGFALTFPLVDGDPVLVVFASRCIDQWWDTGNASLPGDARMHDLSDGFAIPGPRPRPNVLSSMSTSGAELRAASRNSYVRIDQDGNVTVLASGDVSVTAAGDATVIAAGQATVQAPTITLSGAVTVSGTLNVTGAATLSGGVTTPSATIGGVPFSTHIHGNVQNGSGQTNGPVSP